METAGEVKSAASLLPSSGTEVKKSTWTKMGKTTAGAPGKCTLEAFAR